MTTTCPRAPRGKKKNKKINLHGERTTKKQDKLRMIIRNVYISPNPFLDLDFPEKKNAPSYVAERRENDSRQSNEIQAKSHLTFSESLKLESKIGYVCRNERRIFAWNFQDFLFRSSIIWFKFS